jgi:uncharacterized repeat protein (TIGR01451 family)
VSAHITVKWTQDGFTQNLTTTMQLGGNCKQDTGSLKLTKSLTGGPQGYTGPFSIGYVCDVAHTGTASIAAGSSTTISGIPVGTICTVNEAPAAPPSGWSFGATTFTDSSGTANDGVVTITTAGALVEVTVNNTLVRGKGYLKISKAFDAKSSGFTGAFTINYTCGSSPQQSVVLHGGESATVGPFDAGTQCTVSEPSLPSAPNGWTFGAPSISGSPATVNNGSESAAVTVTVTNTVAPTETQTPPSSTSPPTTPAPTVDVAITKSATPSARLPVGGGTVPITYTLVVSNAGPSTAANVKVADAAPASVTFLSATASAGNCTTTALALDCTISTLAAGAAATITINATVTTTGTKTNIATVSTTTPETNTANNTAQAQTVVTAPVTPPTPTAPPKPKPAPTICTTVVATQKTLKANGTSQTIKLKVTRGSKPVTGATLRVAGPGIAKTVHTGTNGLIAISVKPNKPGILKINIVGATACNTQRLGVIGSFQPPVTG